MDRDKKNRLRVRISRTCQSAIEPFAAGRVAAADTELLDAVCKPRGRPRISTPQRTRVSEMNGIPACLSSISRPLRCPCRRAEGLDSRRSRKTVLAGCLD
jgi:hypothetical protein